MSPRPLRLAVPKGRLMQSTLTYLSRAGVTAGDDLDPGRKLVLDVPGAEDHLGAPLQLLLLKNADVPTYVEHGVADAGVSGTDVLEESDAEVLRPFTFPFGSCRVALAARRGVGPEVLERPSGLRIATKYVRRAHRLAAARGWSAEIVELSGSVELGAVLGLADVILDLVETGRTLEANDLEIVEVVDHTRVKLIAAPALSGARRRSVGRLVDAFCALEEDDRE